MAAVLHHVSTLDSCHLLEAALISVGSSCHDDCLAQLANDQHLAGTTHVEARKSQNGCMQARQIPRAESKYKVSGFHCI